MKLIALAAALAFSGAATAQTTDTTTTETTTTTTADPVGGYAPTTPLMSGTPQPGQQVIFVPNPQTPTQAFPPPPPQSHYPICKRGQTDHCMQRGGK